MDTFFEQIVKKKKSPLEWLIIVGTVIAGLAVILLAWRYAGFLAAFIIVAALYGGWWLLTSQNKEYEYCVTNGDIDIDLIIARRSRKRVVSVAGRKIEALLPYEKGAVSTAAFQRVLVAAPSGRVKGLWYFTYHSKKKGHTLIIFQPSERVLKALRGGLSKLVQMDTDAAMQRMGIE